MSRSKPETRKELVAFCLRKLGEPVIAINVAPVQVEDCIDQALEYFQRNHYDGSQHLFIPFMVDEEVVKNGYFKVDDSILGITRILEMSGGFGGSGPDAMMTYEWQAMAGAARSLGGCLGCSMCGGQTLGYVSYLQDRNLLKYAMGGNSINMQWSRHTDKLYINGQTTMMKPGVVLVAEVMRVLVPDEHPQVWNDPFLKKYATALIKQQWGNNLRKMRNIPLAGGITLQGEEILLEANDEIAALEENMQSEWQEPPMPLLG